MLTKQRERSHKQKHWRRKRGGGGGGGGKGGMCPPLFWLGGQWFVCAPPLLTPHFYFPLELYVFITLTNNYLVYFIYQLIILWTISINWHRWLLLNNHTSKYNSFILVLYRRYKNHVSVCPPTFWHIATPLKRIDYERDFSSGQRLRWVC